MEKDILRGLPAPSSLELEIECASDKFNLSPSGMAKRIFATYQLNKPAVGEGKAILLTAELYSFSAELVRDVVEHFLNELH